MKSRDASLKIRDAPSQTKKLSQNFTAQGAILFGPACWYIGLEDPRADNKNREHKPPSLSSFKIL